MNITIREVTTSIDNAHFWFQLYEYFRRDLFPEGTPDRDEELDYFLGEDYRAATSAARHRAEAPLYDLFFQRDGEDIGFARCAFYPAEGGKVVIMEFCVLPPWRGGGTGKACAALLLDWCRARGAAYFELNADGERRVRFWQASGFVSNGVDEWGMPMMVLLPPTLEGITVERLTDLSEDWQLVRLENGFRADIGEEALSETQKSRLLEAVQAGVIAFFVARWGSRLVGMCSVAPCYSTFACGMTGVYDDFYIEPAFRKRGVARQLAQAAQQWCRSEGMASLSVTCAPCDEQMYRSLGFDLPLGHTFVCGLEDV